MNQVNKLDLASTANHTPTKNVGPSDNDMSEVFRSYITKEESSRELPGEKVTEIKRDGLNGSAFSILAEETRIHIFSMLDYKTRNTKVKLVCHDFYRLASDTSLIKVQALEFFREACADALSIEDLEERVKALKHLASLAQKLGEQASHIVSDCMDAVDYQSIKDHRTLCAIAELHIAANQPEAALEILVEVKNSIICAEPEKRLEFYCRQAMLHARIDPAAALETIAFVKSSFNALPNCFFESLEQIIICLAKADPRKALKNTEELDPFRKLKTQLEILKSVEDLEIIKEGLTLIESARNSTLSGPYFVTQALVLLINRLVEKRQKEEALEKLKEAELCINSIQVPEDKCCAFLQIAELQNTLVPEKAHDTRLRLLVKLKLLEKTMKPKISLMFIQHLIHLNKHDIACDYLKPLSFKETSLSYDDLAEVSKQLCDIIKSCSEDKLQRIAFKRLVDSLLRMTNATYFAHDPGQNYAVFAQFLDQVALLSPEFDDTRASQFASMLTRPFGLSLSCRLALMEAQKEEGPQRSQLIEKAASLAESMYKDQTPRDTPMFTWIKRAEYVHILLKIAEVQYKFDQGLATETLVKAFDCIDTEEAEPSLPPHVTFRKKEFIQLAMDAIATCSVPFPQKILAAIPKPILFTIKAKANRAKITLNKLAVAK